jgi:hypothetical protein
MQHMMGLGSYCAGFGRTYSPMGIFADHLPTIPRRETVTVDLLDSSSYSPSKPSVFVLDDGVNSISSMPTDGKMLQREVLAAFNCLLGKVWDHAAICSSSAAELINLGLVLRYNGGFDKHSSLPVDKAAEALVHLPPATAVAELQQMLLQLQLLLRRTILAWEAPSRSAADAFFGCYCGAPAAEHPKGCVGQRCEAVTVTTYGTMRSMKSKMFPRFLSGLTTNDNRRQLGYGCFQQLLGVFNRQLQHEAHYGDLFDHTHPAAAAAAAGGAHRNRPERRATATPAGKSATPLPPWERSSISVGAERARNKCQPRSPTVTSAIQNLDTAFARSSSGMAPFKDVSAATPFEFADAVHDCAVPAVTSGMPPPHSRDRSEHHPAAAASEKPAARVASPVEPDTPTAAAGAEKLTTTLPAAAAAEAQAAAAAVAIADAELARAAAVLEGGAAKREAATVAATAAAAGDNTAAAATKTTASSPPEAADTVMEDAPPLVAPTGDTTGKVTPAATSGIAAAAARKATTSSAAAAAARKTTPAATSGAAAAAAGKAATSSVAAAAAAAGKAAPAATAGKAAQAATSVAAAAAAGDAEAADDNDEGPEEMLDFGEDTPEEREATLLQTIAELQKQLRQMKRQQQAAAAAAAAEKPGCKRSRKH